CHHRRDGGSDRDAQRLVEDVLGHRLARGLDDFAAVADRRDSQGARLSDRRRPGAAARGGAPRPGGGPGGPVQEAGAVALVLPQEYYAKLAASYQQRRDALLAILERHHFTCYKPFGAYYIMTDISTFGFADDVEFARYLVKDVGVAAVPGSSFYKTGAGRTKLRFCFCKRDETLQEADRRLLKLVPAGVTLH